MIANYVLWNVLGPFQWESLLLIAAVLGFAIRRVMVLREPETGPREPTPLLRPAALAFAALSCLAPWGLNVPTEVTFINTRMMTIAVALLLATVDPRWFTERRARTVLVATCAFVIAHFGGRAVQFNREAHTALGLIAHADGNKVLMSLPFHNKSTSFAAQFRLTHFLPMYYLIERRGIATQFWARYTEHLPIDYNPGKKPKHTPDWMADKFQADHLNDSDYVLVQAAASDDTAETGGASNRATSVIKLRGREIGCDGLWCLYSLK